LVLRIASELAMRSGELANSFSQFVYGEDHGLVA